MPAQLRLERRQWELCLLSELRTALRAGAVWVDGSRRYQPADRYLISPAAWPPRRAAARDLLGLPAHADGRLEQLSADVDERVAALDRVLASGHTPSTLMAESCTCADCPATGRNGTHALLLPTAARGG